MNRQISLLSKLAFLVVFLVFLGSSAYADDISRLMAGNQAVRDDRARVEDQLGIDPQLNIFPQATSYYDDLEDHYENVLIMSDFIDKGIR